MWLWLRKWQRKQSAIKRKLKDTPLFHIWGHRIFDNNLWKINKRSVVGGLALGLFVAFMPTLGIQMILAAFGAICFKVNLPIALAACWVTNPLTALPIYLAAWRLGRYLLDDFTPLREIIELYNIEGKTVGVLMQGLYLWTGSFIFSLGSALGANIIVGGLWELTRRQRNKRTLRKQPTESPNPDSNQTTTARKNP